MILAEAYFEILSSPAHMLAELTVELVTGCVLYPLGRAWLRRHDRHHTDSTREST